MRKLRSSLSIVLVCMLLFASCGQPANAPSESVASQNPGASATAATDPNAVITLALTGVWDSLCPLASTTIASDSVCNTIMENLFEPDGKGDYTGRLGESYEIVDNNTALVVKLRQDVVWHDGEPFDADDVMYSIGLYTDGSYTTSRRLFFQQIEGCTPSGVEISENSAKVDKIDQYTVKFYYRSPKSLSAMFSQVGTFFIFPEHHLKDADPAKILENDFWVNPIGTGPFTYESQVIGESITLKSFDKYYLGKPKFGKLVMKVVTSANLVTSMMTKEIDIIPGCIGAIADTDYDMAKTLDGYSVKSLEGTSTQWLVLNNHTFGTPKVRKALAMMFDKENMIKAGCNNNAKPMVALYPPKSMYYDEAVIEELGYKFDPDEAYKMLVEEGFDFNRTYVAVINDLPVRQSIMTILQETWAKYGMKLEIKTLDTQTCIATMREEGADFWINGGTGADVTDLSLYFLDWVSINEDKSYAPFNLSRVDDPTLMGLMQELGAAVNEDDAMRITSQVQRQLLTDYNYLYILSPNINVAFSNRVKGVDEEQMLSATFNYHDWEVTA